MITTLTAAQERQLTEYRAHVLQRGRSTEPIDRPRIIEAITRMYELIGKPAPLFVFGDSIYACELQANMVNRLLSGQLSGQLWDQLSGQLSDQLRGQLSDQLSGQLSDQLSDQLWGQLRSQQLQFFSTWFWGQYDYYWVAYYKYPLSLGVTYPPDLLEKLLLWEKLAESAHLWWAFDGIVFVSERPTKLCIDARGRLHNDDGAAIEYSDGYRQYWMHGTRVPEELAMTPTPELKPGDLKKYDNAEVRMQFIRKLGVDRLKEKGTVVDKRGSYELIDMHPLFDGVRYAPYLFMVNPSTGAVHAEGVHPDCKTVQQAINWRGGDIERVWEPLQLT